MPSGGDDGSKRRRRKRKKQAPTTASSEPTASTPPTASTIDDEEKKRQQQALEAKRMAREMLQQENLMYDTDDIDLGPAPANLEDDDRIRAAASKAGYDIVDNGGDELLSATGEQLEDLFDSREFLQRKREKQIDDQGAEAADAGGAAWRRKIKRSDTKAFTKLLEMDPLADEDDSYFEEREYDSVSAWLGERTDSFVGVGSGPLQVGHFVGALALVLMAFVEYPGFPLTDLPSPLRGALQGGLATVYTINIVLSIVAFFNAPSRKQPPALWAAKTLAVGAIAYDQLMQIATPEELEQAKRVEEQKKREEREYRKKRRANKRN